MNLSRKHLLTGAVVTIAVLVVLLKYWDYVLNPWTRDGQVRAEVIQIAPRVSGPIVSLPVKDNQFVNAGDLLFEIDPRTYAASQAQAQAQYDMTDDNYLATASNGKTHKDGLRIRSRCLFNTSKLRNVFCGFVATCLSHILAAFIESNSLDIRIRNI